MKRVFIIVVGLLLVLVSFSIVFINLIWESEKGNISNAEIVIGDSKIYSEEDIKSAMYVALGKFRDFPATLDKIWYDESSSLKVSDEWAKKYSADEAIVLYSDFSTYSGDVALSDGFESDSHYTDWDFVLIRNGNEPWKLIAWGY